MSFKNAGGIRDHIGLVVQPPGTTQPADVVFLPSPANPDAGKRKGDISQFNVEGVLRFNNGVAIVPLTARRFVEVVEHAVGFDGPGEVTHGRFPQVGGMRFSFDPSAPAGRRVRSLAVVDEGGAVTDRVVEDGMLVGDPEREIRVATLNFLANGGDGYPFPLPAAGRIDLAGEAVQSNAPSPDFPDTNGNGVIDGPVSASPASPASPRRAASRTPWPGTSRTASPRRRSTWPRWRRARIGASRTSACRVCGTRCSTRRRVSEAARTRLDPTSRLGFQYDMPRAEPDPDRARPHLRGAR